MWGIDFYEGEGRVNIGALRHAGCEFILHQSFSYQWKYKADTLVPYHYYQSERCDMLMSFYHVWNYAVKPEVQAEDFISSWPGKPMFRVAVDFETYVDNWKKAGESMALLLDLLYVSTGLKPAIYCNLNYATLIARNWGAWVTDYPLWYARPQTKEPPAPKPWESIWLWQDKWNLRLPGAGSNLDRDILFGAL